MRQTGYGDHKENHMQLTMPMSGSTAATREMISWCCGVDNDVGRGLCGGHAG
jgi:hypothetical protein